MDKTQWYKETGENLANSIFQRVHHLQTIQEFRSELHRRHLRLYGNYDALGIMDSAYSFERSMDRLTLNVIAINVDTATARIAKNRPRPKFLTKGSTIPMERQCQKLEKFVGGLLYQEKAHAKMQAMFRSSCVFGDGFVKVYPNHQKKRVSIDKRFTPNIIVDEQDAMHGDPLCMYEIAILSKVSLIEKYPKLKVQIEASSLPASGFYSEMYTEDQVLVIEAVKKASKNGEPDGRRVICTSHAVLEDFKYTRERFPYVKQPYQVKEIGYYSEGIAEMLTSIQYELNKTLIVAQQAVNLCVPKLMVHADCQVVSEHLNNEIGSIYRYTGMKPEWSTLIGVPGDVKEHIQELYEKSFQRTGLSNLSAFGEKPANISSGKGLREYNDIETERFAIVSQNYENAYMDLWELCTDAAEQLAKEDKKLSVTVLDKGMMDKIAWNDIDLDRDSYAMQPYPASMLGDNPTGRYDDITDMMDRGLLDKEQATELLQFPDIESYFIEANSPRKNIRTVVSAIVEKGVYYPPTEYQSLELGIKIMNNMLLYYTDRELEPERLELFARWISDAQAIMNPIDAMTPEEQEQAIAIQAENDALTQQAMAEEELAAQQEDEAMSQLSYEAGAQDALAATGIQQPGIGPEQL